MASVAKGLPGQMEEDGLEVGLVHIDGTDGDAGIARGGQELGKDAPSVIDDQLHRPVLHARRPHGLKRLAGVGSRLQIADALQRDAVVLTDERNQLRAGSFRLELPEVYDPDSIAEPFSLLHVVGRVEHRHTLDGEPLDALEDGVAALRVDPDGRLIQDQEPRTVQQPDADV